jgi:hypothetical protein
MPDSLFDTLEPDAQQELWGRLEELLEDDFDFAKIVVLELDADAVESGEWGELEPLCWINRQGSDLADPLSSEEIAWLAKHLDKDEASVINGDFGIGGLQAAVVYLNSYSDDENIEPKRVYYCSFTRDLEGC